MRLPDYAKKYLNTAVYTQKNWHDQKLEGLIPQGGRVIDIGCAGSSLLHRFASKNMQYTWLDYNEVFVKNGQDTNVDVRLFDASKDTLPFEDTSIDIVYCSHVIEHLLANEQIYIMAEISRVLKPGGVVFLLAPTPYHWFFWDDPTHQRALTHGSLQYLARDAGLTVQECKYTKLRFFGQWLQRWLRLPPMRFFLWEVYLVAKKS